MDGFQRTPFLGSAQVAKSPPCTYPTGEKVVGVHIFDLREGKIVRETSAEAWDE